MKNIIPFSNNAEKALLACCIIDSEKESLMSCIEAKISEEFFLNPSHKIIFNTLFQCFKKNIPINANILIEELRYQNKLEIIGGIDFIKNICNTIDSTSNINYYINKVKDFFLLRKIIKTSTRIIQKASSKIEHVKYFLEEVEQEFLNINEDRIINSTCDFPKILDKAVLLINNMIKNKNQSIGIKSGFIELDHLISGLNPSEMIIIAARPAMGKTSLALNIAENVMIASNKNKNPAPTLFFSLEMDSSQLAIKLLCSLSKVNLQNIKTGIISNNDFNEIKKAEKILRNAPLWIDDEGSLTILEIRAKARRLNAQKKLGLIIIDYLQLINGSNNKLSREQQISEISRGIKSMAKELQVPIIVLSQLNRDSEKEKRTPRLSDLRESGSIEQDADMVILLSSSKKNDIGTKENLVYIDLIIAKQRNGPIGTITLCFNKSITKFENLKE